MSTAGFLEICLLLAVFVPLLSFVFLVFFGTRLPGRGASAGGGHDDHGHGHGDSHDPHVHAHADHVHGAHAHDSHSHDTHAHADAAHGDGHGFPKKIRRIPRGNPTAAFVATAAIAFSFLMSAVVLFVWAGKDPEGSGGRAELTQEAAKHAIVWANLGPVPIEFGVKLDSLTIIMFFMVTLCATCIHVFSIGYMKNDPRFPRFFTYLSLFCFSMLGLLISLNILFLFIFWELVGLCSYLLIGFWFEKKSASNAAIKAFVTNRVGDFGFLIGMMLVYAFLGTLSIDGSSAAFAKAAHAHQSGTTAPGVGLFSAGFWGVSLATWMGIGLFCGAIGKSAQFPLQVWLPDAMEGPTPVSALIHAATMVAAGVYLVGRIYPLLTPEAQMVIAVIGCITLTMAALIAIVQTDIKRVLAFSTLSQLGYMIFAMGVGAWIAALFHLLTHAFFKAMLFLGSGQVIEGCHHEQDMRKMGGLRSKMPGTANTFLLAVLAISGAGIPWTHLGLGGFYSKDEILVVAHARHHSWDASHAAAGGHSANTGHAAEHAEAPSAQSASHATGAAEGHGPDYAAQYPAVPKLPWLLYALPILIAYITPFYMGRAYILTFMGKPRDQHIHDHAHESKIMVYPLFVLAAMTIVSGPFIFRNFVMYSAPQHPPLVPMIDGMPPPELMPHSIHHAHEAMRLIVGFAFIVGLGLAYAVYRNGLAFADSIARLPFVRPIHALLWNKFYFDHLYNFFLVGGTRVISIIAGLFDNWVIDGLVNAAGNITKAFGFFTGRVLDNKGVDGAVNGTGWLAWNLGGAFRTAHTGIIRNYLLITGIVVTGVLIGLWSISLAVIYVVLGSAIVAAPAFSLSVLYPAAVASLLIRVGRIVLTGFGQTGAVDQWAWHDLTYFWSAYFLSSTGFVELVVVLLVFAVLYARFNTSARDVEYAPAR